VALSHRIWLPPSKGLGGPARRPTAAAAGGRSQGNQRRRGASSPMTAIRSGAAPQP